MKALNSGDLNRATDYASDALFDEEPPVEPRVITNDAAVEKIGELLNQNQCGLVQCRDELAGWLASMDREGREADRGFWLEAWNGKGGYTVDRIGRGTIHIQTCAFRFWAVCSPANWPSMCAAHCEAGSQMMA